MTPSFSALLGTAGLNGEIFKKFFPGWDLVVKIPPGRQQNPSENPAGYADKYIVVTYSLKKSYEISHKLKGSK